MKYSLLPILHSLTCQGCRFMRKILSQVRNVPKSECVWGFRHIVGFVVPVPMEKVYISVYLDMFEEFLGNVFFWLSNSLEFPPPYSSFDTTSSVG